MAMTADMVLDLLGAGVPVGHSVVLTTLFTHHPNDPVMAAVEPAGPGSALDRFVGDLRTVLAGGVGEEPDRAVTVVEERVRDSLHDDGFVLDCLEAAVTDSRPVRGLVHRESNDLSLRSISCIGRLVWRAHRTSTGTGR